MSRKHETHTHVKLLPMQPATWELSLRTPVFRDEGGLTENQLPTIAIVHHLEKNLILGSEIFAHLPEAQEVATFLRKIMRQPSPESQIEPHRPSLLAVEIDGLARALQPLMEKIGVEVVVQRLSPELEELVREFDSIINEAAEEGMISPPGLLSVEGVTPELVGDLFSSAAFFYRQAPWESLEDWQAIEARFKNEAGEEDASLIAVVIGAAGEEYGLAVFHNIDEIQRINQQDFDHPDGMDNTRLQGITFDTIENVPDDDLKAIEQYGWEVADESAYPVPAIYTADSIERPSRQELIQYTTLLRLIPPFIQNLELNEEFDFDPCEAEMSTLTQDGEVRLTLRYPVQEFEE